MNFVSTFLNCIGVEKILVKTETRDQQQILRCVYDEMKGNFAVTMNRACRAFLNVARINIRDFLTTPVRIRLGRVDCYFVSDPRTES